MRKHLGVGAAVGFLLFGSTPLLAQGIGHSLFMRGKIVDWWLPNDVAFVDSMPMTGTGKIHKLTLRQQFAGHVLPGSAPAR